MADTASRPQTPTRKLFKPSTKTKTPTPSRRPPAISSTPQKTTPQSAQSNKSGRVSPTLFRQSGSTPKLVKKASSHPTEAPTTTPSKPAADDIVSSTPLAPLTSKLDAADGRLSEYAASDTTGDPPIGMVDNDVLTPTDTVSRSTADAPKALSREASETRTGAAGGSPRHDSTQPGSVNEKSETASNGSAEKSHPMRTEATEESDKVDDAKSKLPDSVSDKIEDILPDDAADKLSDPGDLVKYFSDQGHPELSDFVKALIAPQEDPTNEAIDALSLLADDKDDTAQSSRDTEGDTPQASKDPESKPSPESDLATELIAAVQRANGSSQESPDQDREAKDDSPAKSPEISTNDQLASELLAAVQRGGEIAKSPSEPASERVDANPDISSDPTKELPTSDDSVSVPKNEAKDTAESTENSKNKVRDTVGGFPEVSADPVKELPTDSGLVVEPSSEVQDTSDAAFDSADGERSTVDGFPEVSQNPIDELPTNDDLVAGAAGDKVQDATDAVPPVVSQAQEKERPEVNKSKNKEDQSGKDQSQLSKDRQDAVKGASSDKVEGSDTESITQGKDTLEETSEKPFDIRDTISTPGKELGIKSAEDKSAEDKPEASKLSEEPLGLANGSAQQAMAGAKEDLAAKAPQKPDAPKATGHVKRSGNSVQAEVDNMGKPARLNRRIDIPLSRPQRPSSSRKSDMQIPEVDNLHKDTLPNIDEVDDPPEDFLDPTIHSPERPAAKISPIPQVSKVNPIDSQPPPDLARLASGLGGNSIDDVGNIVDESGKVLGHATGDLPSMIGKKVANNGEVYGDNGELIGYVTENFTGHPPTASEPPQENGVQLTALPGGLRVDIKGNILDGTGNVIGKLNKPLAADSTQAVDSYAGGDKGAPKTGADGEEEKPEDEKQRAKFDESGIPADIFLDVKSTPDGIQVTIRIPTIFKQESRQPAQ